MINHDFQIINTDTDSIFFCKSNGKPFTKEEQEFLLEELHIYMPPMIKWESDGYYKKVLIVKAKNYILDDGKKRKVKGNALRCPMKEKALKEFVDNCVELLLNDKKDQIIDLYYQYVREIKCITDITRWSLKKTVTSSVLHPKRTNEQNVLDAIKDIEYAEGDKVFLYFDINDKLKLQDFYNNDHSVDRLLEKLYKTMNIFSTVLDINMIPNLKLKKNKKILEKI